MQPEQTKATRVVIMSHEETDLVDQETRKMLSKGTISVAKNLDGQFLSALLLVGKKDGGGEGNRIVINLKELKKVVPYAHFGYQT